jgi:hypothetical protein
MRRRKPPGPSFGLPENKSETEKSPYKLGVRVS